MNWSRFRGKNYHQDTHRRKQRCWQHKKSTWIWQPKVPLWKIPIMEDWNSSAAKEAFDNAKQRFWETTNGLPCSIPLPDPDLYIDKIDWNAHIDPDLLADLEAARKMECPYVIIRLPDITDEIQSLVKPTGWDVASDDYWFTRDLTGLLVGDDVCNKNGGYTPECGIVEENGGLTNERIPSDSNNWENDNEKTWSAKHNFDSNNYWGPRSRSNKKGYLNSHKQCINQSRKQNSRVQDGWHWDSRNESNKRGLKSHKPGTNLSRDHYSVVQDGPQRKIPDSDLNK